MRAPSGRRGDIVRCFAIMLVAVLAGACAQGDAFAQPLPRAVLVLDEPDPSSGMPTTMSATVRQSLDQRTPHIAVYGETLDFRGFTGPRQEEILRTYLREKYRDVRFGAIVTVGVSALDFATRERPQLWPGTTIVFGGIDQGDTAAQRIEPRVTGLVTQRSVGSMVDVARRLVPDLASLAVLGGSLERDPYRHQYAQELRKVGAEIPLTNLTGRPLEEQASRAATLPANAAILYTSLFVDDAGNRYSSEDALAAIARVANRPIVVDVGALVGSGATGGVVLDNVAYGKEMASLVERVLGNAGAIVPVAATQAARPVFDARQLKRWGIEPVRLPPGSEIRFREPSPWEQYRTQILLALAVLLVQSAIIWRLLLEHHRRRVAESLSHERLLENIRLNRAVTVEAISRSIVHELKQPLTAIASNARAAQRMLAKGSLDGETLKEILVAIDDEVMRSDAIITHLRQLLQRKPDIEYQEFDLNEAIRGALGILASEVADRHVALDTRLSATGLPIRADSIHVQQVVLNIAMNAMEAMASCEPHRRSLSVLSVPAGDSEALVTISDTGPGIAEADRDRIFEPFVTTKTVGTGLGLSIARTIIETYRGKIWVENRAGGGAAFIFTLPLANAPRAGAGAVPTASRATITG